MSNSKSNQFQLSVTYSHEVWRTNEKDNSNYVTMMYRILKDETSPEAIEQYCNDTIAAGYKVITDDETGEVLYRTTRPVAEGCKVVRSHSGKWYPDMSSLRNLQAYAAILGSNNVADALIRNAQKQTTVHATDEKTESIDPFK